jgi:uncharacterized protein YbjT (DUF2867 family)
LTRHAPALVLGCTGSLGTHLVRSLLARGTPVVGLVRRPRPDSPFKRERLFEQVRIVRGDINDADALARLLAVHEVGAVYQCAAGDSPPGTHALTRRVMSAVATGRPEAAVVVPLAAGTPAPRFRTTATGGLRVAFVRLSSITPDAVAAMTAAADVVAAADPVPTTGLWVTADRPSLPRAA